MMKINELKDFRNYEEAIELSKKLQLWLRPYTQVVYEKVMSKIEEIVENEFAMKLITELYERSLKETSEEVDRIMFDLTHREDKELNSIHNHCLTHSSSYRDILFDLYIKD